MAKGSKKNEGRLREAIEAGEVLNIIYRGGSQPGTLREIAPISIKGDKLRARCYSSHAVKTFAIEKIIIVEGDEQPDVVEWQPSAKPLKRYSSIAELLEKERKFLARLGWHIESNNECLSLHRRFKNGRPRKGSDVSLDYEEYTYDMLYGDDDEFHQEKRKKVKPWTLRGKNKDTRTYGHFVAAANAFIDWAESMAPINLNNV